MHTTRNAYHTEYAITSHELCNGIILHHRASARYTISDELGREAVRHVTNHVRLYQSNKLAGSQASTKIKVSYIAHHSALTAAKPIHRPQLYTVNQPTQNFFSSFCLQFTKNETNTFLLTNIIVVLILYQNISTFFLFTGLKILPPLHIPKEVSAKLNLFVT